MDRFLEKPDNMTLKEHILYMEEEQERLSNSDNMDMDYSFQLYETLRVSRYRLYNTLK